jgi:hypothetical protein
MKSITDKIRDFSSSLEQVHKINELNMLKLLENVSYKNLDTNIFDAIIIWQNSKKLFDNYKDNFRDEL